MSLSNLDAQSMSMGELQATQQKMGGALADAANSLSNGKAPVFEGSGDILSSDVALGAVTGGSKAGAAVSAASTFSEMRPTTSQSSFFTPAANTSKRHRNGLGVQMSYQEIKAEAKRELREMSFIARNGYMPVRKDQDGPLRKAEGVFEGAKITAMSIGPGGYMPKFAVFTPEMLLNLGLVPHAIKQSIDSVHRQFHNPNNNQIIAGFNKNEQSGDELFKNSTDQTKQQVLDVLSTDQARIKADAHMKKSPRASKPAVQAPPMPSSASGRQTH